MLTTLFCLVALMVTLSGFWVGKLSWWSSIWGFGVMSFYWFLVSSQEVLSPCMMAMELFSDPLSWVLVELSLLLSPLCLLASGKINFFMVQQGGFIFSIVFSALCLVLAFISQSLLWFYYWFEASLVPLLWLLMGWGYQPERVQATNYLLLYTMTSSLPFLGLVGWVHTNICSFFLWGCYFELPKSPWWVVVFLPFLVKAPLYGVHSWLPKAHVEAPVAGSMLLAGLTLKLGGYGLIRMIEIFKIKFSVVLTGFIVFSIWGSLLTCFICSRQDDVKSLIAYSSVSHMGLVLCGILTVSFWGWLGSVVLMVGHAFSSSGLFFLAGVLFNAFSTRSLRVYGGVLSACPVGLLLGFGLLCGNMAAPFTSNLCGEVMLVLSLVGSLSLIWPVLVFISLLTAAYSLQLFSALFNGSRGWESLSWGGLSFSDMYVMWFHFICMIFCIFFLDLCVGWV